MRRSDARLPEDAPTALILEATFRGHKGTYVRWAAQGLRAAGWRVVVGTTAEAARHPGFAQHVAPLGDEIRIETVRGHALDGELEARSRILRLLRARLHHWRLFRRLHRRARRHGRVDVVFIPSLSYLLEAIGLLGSPFGATPWSGIVLPHLAELAADAPRRRWRRRLRDGVAPAWTRAALRGALPVFTIEPRNLQLALPAGTRPWVLLHDPVTAPTAPAGASRSSLGIPAQAYVVLLYGAVRLRKGLAELLRAAMTPGCEAHVLCAGETDEPARRALQSGAAATLRAQGRLHVIDRYVSEDEQEQVYAAADLVWLVYHDHPAMSGVLMQAAVRGLPVLSQGRGAMGELTRAHELGLVADFRDAAEVAARLREAQARSWDHAALRRRALEAFREHRPEEFGARIAQTLSGFASA